ncbi:phage tail protein [Lacinutrix mariniflava]|uniref:phage tail protein n=1 Tax=Lacinutrix mariniflava TaxID=342955 RepID=UPI0006E1D215|nr:tail fiber protein [Lacinutrix mariniflava]
MEQFIGQIMMFGGNFAPRNWALCDGQLLAISQYSALFSILGTNYGGDGRTTFGLPDLRGRVPVHQGAGPGLPAVRLGQKGGTATNKLTEGQLPAHKHSATLQAVSPILRGVTVGANPTGTYSAEGGVYASGANAQMATDSIIVGSTGSNQDVNNMQPFTGVNYIIALEGFFPPRS